MITLEESIWQKVLFARHQKRPTSIDLISYLIDGFIEVHGDRHFGDDKSMICGIGLLNGQPVTVIGQEKGKSTKEKIEHNFGMAHPEGYRKALRAMKQAEKFHRPILFIIDTPGAYPGIGAEERGQASAIATNLAEMMTLKVPLIAIVLSEGGSGGALAIGVSDYLYMFENAIYSVLSPEGFASILYKDASLAKKAAAIMKLTANDLLEYQVIDEIIPECSEGLHHESKASFHYLKESITQKFQELASLEQDELLKRRYEKFRCMGKFIET